MTSEIPRRFEILQPILLRTPAYGGDKDTARSTSIRSWEREWNIKSPHIFPSATEELADVDHCSCVTLSRGERNKKLEFIGNCRKSHRTLRSSDAAPKFRGKTLERSAATRTTTATTTGISGINTRFPVVSCRKYYICDVFRPYRVRCIKVFMRSKDHANRCKRRVSWVSQKIVAWPMKRCVAITSQPQLIRTLTQAKKWRSTLIRNATRP